MINNLSTLVLACVFGLFCYVCAYAVTVEAITLFRAHNVELIEPMP